MRFKIIKTELKLFSAVATIIPTLRILLRTYYITNTRLKCVALSLQHNLFL